MNLGETPGQRMANFLHRKEELFDKPNDELDLSELYPEKPPTIIEHKRITDVKRHSKDEAEIAHGRRTLATNVALNITKHILAGSCWGCGQTDVPFKQQMKNNGLCEEHKS